ncbi:LacI family DNA-binding transcriptional regulator [Actinophytocola oryzae]|uniref:LacI family transcriptional regulator n=1 Tax=Actinophytocola oryzae TaxID=502181 RepID=A0A4R7UV70_9PSEU|nr:LacI family DNA-binding transcriptional regulator [Actinophytocola oryzae]TDV38570.1 LacI family transcriptional regulator [Actinophytocola oryzae]
MAPEEGSSRTPRPRMADVARLAGVSPMTVSRVLKDPSKVSQDAVGAVLDAVETLGYRRNENARNLRLGRERGLIGLIVTNLTNPFYAQLAVGVESFAGELGMRVIIGNSAGSVAKERQLVHDFASRGLGGIVAAPCSSDHRHFEPSLLAAMPVVFVASPGLKVAVDEVLLDDFGGTWEIVRRLVDKGHRKIAFVGFSGAMWTGSERFRGYCMALEEAGIPIDPRYVARQPGDEQAAAATITRELLDLDDPPTAVFAANNRNTVGAYRTIVERGADVELAGFDDFELADLLARPVTVVRYDAHELGRSAARILHERGENPHVDDRFGVRRLVLPTEVVEHGAVRR